MALHRGGRGPWHMARAPLSIAQAPANITLAVQDFTTGTSTTGNQDHTTTALGGLTPKAALIWSVYHNVANEPSTETTRATAMIAAIDDGNREKVISTTGQDGNATTNSRNFGFDVNRSLHLTEGAVIRKDGNGLLIADGLQMNYITSNTLDMRMAYVAFAGSNVSARAGDTALGTGTSAIDVTAPGFQPDLVIFLTNNGNMGGSGGTDFRFSFGMATSDGTQRCVVMAETSGLADSAPFQALLTDCCAGQKNGTTGAMDYKVTVGSFDSSGFSLTPSASAGNDLLAWLALKFTGGAAKIVDFTTPTSTGSSTISGAGFTPRLAILVLTNLEAVDTNAGTTSDLQSGFSIAFIGDEQWAGAMRINAGEATTDTASLFKNVALLGASATSCAAIEATFTAFTADGVTLNYSAVQGTAKCGWAAFIQ